MSEHKTESDTPELLARLTFPHSMRHVFIYDDGARVSMSGGGGGASCSEHGVLDQFHEQNLYQCDHDADISDSDAEVCDVKDFAEDAAREPVVQDEVLQYLSEAHPEKLVEAAEPFFEE